MLHVQDRLRLLYYPTRRKLSLNVHIKLFRVGVSTSAQENKLYIFYSLTLSPTSHIDYYVNTTECIL